MWFNNALVFQYTFNNPSDLNKQLMDKALKPCPPHARFVYGWLPAHTDEFVHTVAGAMLICMGKEERLLPKSVVQKALAERVQAWEAEHGKAMKRADKAQLTETLEFELLPKSFCLQKRLFGLFDTVSQRFIINTTIPNQAEQFISLLRKSVPGIHIEPLKPHEDLAACFSKWITSPASLPPMFQLASDCLLFSLEDEKKRLNCKGYELPADEILTLLAQGLAPAEIALTWNERIQFTITQSWTLKRIKCLDYLLDEFHEASKLEEAYQQEDATLTLLAGEFRAMINDLLKVAMLQKPLPTETVAAG